MVAQQAALARIRLRQHIGMKPPRQKRREMLRDLTPAVVNLQQISNLVRSRIQRTGMPDFAAEKQHVARFTKNRLELSPVPTRLALLRFAAGFVGASNHLRRT